jgi:glycosyltransferase involved in cell wall biosynthesis
MAGMPPACAPELTIVVPAFNEERRLGATLEAIATFVEQRKLDAEILVVDDGSRDRTRAIVEEAAARIPRLAVLSLPKNRGKGIAVRTGFVAARGELVLFTDADNSTPIEELDRLDATMRLHGASVAIGSRALGDSDVRVRQHLLRQLMGQTFNLVVRILTGLPFKDTQCGFKLFRREACLPVFLAQRVGGFAFDAEVLFLARRFGLLVVEVPVRWINSPDSRVRLLRDPLLMLRDLFRIRLNAMLGRYRAE